MTVLGKESRRGYRFTLRTLLLVFVAMPALMANHLRTTLRQQHAVEAIERLGGCVYYDYEIDDKFQCDPNRRSWLPDWMMDRFGPDWAHSVAVLNMAYRAVDGRVIRNEGCNDDAMYYLDAFPSLQVLVATQRQVTDRSMEQVARLKHLKKLYLSDARGITDTGTERLRKLRGLVSLHLTHASLRDDSLEFVESLPNLKVLSVRGNRLSDDAFANFSRLQQLESLEFGMAEFVVSNDALIQLAELKQLRYVQVASLPLTNEAIDCFGRLSQLEQLCLEDTEITDLARLQTVLPDCRIQLHSTTTWNGTDRTSIRVPGR